MSVDVGTSWDCCILEGDGMGFRGDCIAFEVERRVLEGDGTTFEVDRKTLDGDGIASCCDVGSNGSMLRIALDLCDLRLVGSALELANP
jgi:hypothetical protein